jgi:hypothetical protein
LAQPVTQAPAVQTAVAVPPSFAQSAFVEHSGAAVHSVVVVLHVKPFLQSRSEAHFA